MERLERNFIGLVIKDLEHSKIKRTCKELGINSLTVVNLNPEDFLNRELTLMVIDEVQDIRTALLERMYEEEASGLYHWMGEYMPSDLFMEALIELNTILDSLNGLLEEL